MWPPKSLSCAPAVSRSRKDSPGLKTTDRIADLGFALMAWFIDPGKNCVGMMQLK